MSTSCTDGRWCSCCGGCSRCTSDRPSATACWAGAGGASWRSSWSPYFLLIGGVQFGDALLRRPGLLAFCRGARAVRAHLRAQLAAAGIVVRLRHSPASASPRPARGDRHSRARHQRADHLRRPSARVRGPAVRQRARRRTRPGLGWPSACTDRTSRRALSTSASRCCCSPLVGAGRRAAAPDRPKLTDGAIVAAVAMGRGGAQSGPRRRRWPSSASCSRSRRSSGFEVSPAWRVYSRFVMVVMLAVCVLAAIGLARLLRGRPVARAGAVPLAITAVVVVRPAGAGRGHEQRSPPDPCRAVERRARRHRRRATRSSRPGTVTTQPSSARVA